MDVLGWVLGILLSYFIGSVPFGYLMGRIGGIDIRRWGSGNVGATNVARVLGVRRGILVLVLDALKGVAAVGLVGYGLQGAIPPEQFRLFLVLCGVAVILGHTYTYWLRFKGGKGVAAALGVWLVIEPVPTLLAVAVWGIIVAAWRYVSLGSIIGAIVLPVALIAFHHSNVNAAAPELVFAGLVSVLVIERHRSNIVRLLSGSESKLTEIFVKTVRPPRPDGS